MPQARNAVRNVVSAQAVARRKNQDAAHATREIRENQAEADAVQPATTTTTTIRHATAVVAESKFVFTMTMTIDYDRFTVSVTGHS